jgi:hypothetical protein
MKTSVISAFLDTRRQRLRAADDADRLDELGAAAPQFALKALGDEYTHGSRKAQVLAVLLGGSMDRRQIAPALRSLSDADLVHVLDGLRRRKINGRRARELGLISLLRHERLAELAAQHRLRLVRILKHLLGERTWSSVRRCLAAPSPQGDEFLRRTVLRYASDAQAARDALCFLADARGAFEPSHPALRQSLSARRSIESGEGMPRETLFGIRGTYHRRTPVNVVRRLSAPQRRRGRIDGPQTAAFKEALISDKTLSAGLAPAAGNGSTVDLSAAVVLDLSASAASSGERLYHPAALGLALVEFLERRVRRVAVYQVGGSAALDGRRVPKPLGATDLASAVLEAGRSSPDAILVVTDGYENFRQGDTAQVVEGLARLGLATAVWQIVPVFTAAESLSRRRLGPNIPVLAVDHESSAGEVAARLALIQEQDDLSPAALRSIEQLLFGGV